MGEPGDEARFERASQRSELLDRDPIRDPIEAKNDINKYRTFSIARLDRIIDLLEGDRVAGDSQVGELIKALNDNTRSNVALVRAMQGQPKEPEAPASAPEPAQPQPVTSG